MIDRTAKTLFYLLAKSSVFKRAASRYGMRPSGFARRFVAGETLAEAIDAARGIESSGFFQTLDFLGEGAATLDQAAEATREYVRILDRIAAAGIGRNLSLKLTQLGLDADRACTVDNLRRILDHGEGFFVRVDMESSRYTEVTLDIFETLWQQGYRNIGVVLQADLYRSEGDVRRILALGARIRLVKGAYREPKTIAYTRKPDVDAAYLRLVQLLLAEGTYPAIATHDAVILDEACRFAEGRGIGPDRFEFQMLYGIRRDLQAAYVKRGYRVRIYIPFGREWFPYFMRRLGERPANLLFVLRSLVRETGHSQ